MMHDRQALAVWIRLCDALAALASARQLANGQHDMLDTVLSEMQEQLKQLADRIIPHSEVSDE